MNNHHLPTTPAGRLAALALGVIAFALILVHSLSGTTGQSVADPSYSVDSLPTVPTYSAPAVDYSIGTTPPAPHYVPAPDDNGSAAPVSAPVPHLVCWVQPADGSIQSDVDDTVPVGRQQVPCPGQAKTPTPARSAAPAASAACAPVVVDGANYSGGTWSKGGAVIGYGASEDSEAWSSAACRDAHTAPTPAAPSCSRPLVKVPGRMFTWVAGTYYAMHEGYRTVIGTGPAPLGMGPWYACPA